MIRRKPSPQPSAGRARPRDQSPAFGPAAGSVGIPHLEAVGLVDDPRPPRKGPLPTENPQGGGKAARARLGGAETVARTQDVNPLPPQKNDGRLHPQMFVR